MWNMLAAQDWRLSHDASITMGGSYNERYTQLVLQSSLPSIQKERHIFNIFPTPILHHAQPTHARIHTPHSHLLTSPMPHLPSLHLPVNFPIILAPTPAPFSSPASLNKPALSSIGVQCVFPTLDPFLTASLSRGRAGIVPFFSRCWVGALG